MDSIFTRIIKGEIPCYKIVEDDQFIAFLDVHPVAKGHTLVVPKVEIDDFFELDDDLLRDMIVFAKRVAKALSVAVPCRKVGVTVIGLEVPHAHVHLIPLNEETDMSFTKQRPKTNENEFVLIAGKIREALIEQGVISD